MNSPIHVQKGYGIVAYLHLNLDGHDYLIRYSIIETAGGQAGYCNIRFQAGYDQTALETPSMTYVECFMKII